MKEYAWILAPILTAVLAMVGVAITNAITFSFRFGGLVNKVDEHERRLDDHDHKFSKLGQSSLSKAHSAR